MSQLDCITWTEADGDMHVPGISSSPKMEHADIESMQSAIDSGFVWSFFFFFLETDSKQKSEI